MFFKNDIVIIERKGHPEYWNIDKEIVKNLGLSTKPHNIFHTLEQCVLGDWVGRVGVILDSKEFCIKHCTSFNFFGTRSDHSGYGYVVLIGDNKVLIPKILIKLISKEEI